MSFGFCFLERIIIYDSFILHRTIRVLYTPSWTLSGYEFNIRKIYIFTPRVLSRLENTRWKFYRFRTRCGLAKWFIERVERRARVVVSHHARPDNSVQNLVEEKLSFFANCSHNVKMMAQTRRANIFKQSSFPNSYYIVVWTGARTIWNFDDGIFTAKYILPFRLNPFFVS